MTDPGAGSFGPWGTSGGPTGEATSVPPPPGGTSGASRRTRRIASISVALAIVIIAAAVAVAASTSSTPSTPPGSPAARAALLDATKATASQHGAHVTMAIDERVGTTDVTLRASGVADFAADAMSMTMQETGATSARIEIVYVDRTLYIKLPPTDSSPFGSRSWVSLDVPVLEADLHISATQLSAEHLVVSNDEQVTSVGEVTYGGERVHEYHVAVDIADLGGLLRSIKLPSAIAGSVGGASEHAQETVDIDARGRLVAEAITEEVTTSAGATSDVALRLDLSDYGSSVTVVAPPAGQVTNIDSLLAGLGHTSTI